VFAAVGHYNVKPMFLGMQDSMSKVSYSDGKPYYKVTCKLYFKLLIFGIIMPLALSAGVFMMNKENEFSEEWT